MARFSDINRADELKAAAVKLEAWRKLDAAAKKLAYQTAAAFGGGKRANRASRIGFIQPFGAADKFWCETRILAPNATTPPAGTKEEGVPALISAVLSAVESGINASLPTGAGNFSVEVKKMQFAKVRLTERNGDGSDTFSRITGRPYKKFNSNTISCPYGKGGTFTSEAIARGLMRAALLGTPPNSNKTVGFTPQGNVKIGVNPAAAPTT